MARKQLGVLKLTLEMTFRPHFEPLASNKMQICMLRNVSNFARAKFSNSIKFHQNAF